jgi:hypothetical protein
MLHPPGRVREALPLASPWRGSAAHSQAAGPRQCLGNLPMVAPYSVYTAFSGALPYCFPSLSKSYSKTAFYRGDWFTNTRKTLDHLGVYGKMKARKKQDKYGYFGLQL